jgi:fluoride exporter
VDKYLLIGFGGFLGANARYLFGGWVADRLGPSFPYGTLAINATGSFVIGLFLSLITERFSAPPGLRLLFAIGFLGAYTTFSSFTYESLALLESRAFAAAAANVIGSVVIGLVAVALGAAIGRAL